MAQGRGSEARLASLHPVASCMHAIRSCVSMRVCPRTPMRRYVRRVALERAVRIATLKLGAEHPHTAAMARHLSAFASAEADPETVRHTPIAL